MKCSVTIIGGVGFRSIYIKLQVSGVLHLCERGKWNERMTLLYGF